MLRSQRRLITGARKFGQAINSICMSCTWNAYITPNEVRVMDTGIRLSQELLKSMANDIRASTITNVEKSSSNFSFLVGGREAMNALMMDRERVVGKLSTLLSGNSVRNAAKTCVGVSVYII
mmetsp:Transcript_24221/g.67091  ORF Transcript_24221/g.67091 Transcript_24221/m.67091 type:complete len:122 (-) Transcript_24221:630-995(-)